MSATGERRDGRRTDTRDRIVATALDLFGSRGFTGTSLQDIADALGVTKAAVYYHFQAKGDLARDIFEPFIADVDATLTELERSRPGQRAALTAYLDALAPHHAAFAAMARDPAAVSTMDLGAVGRRWIDRMTGLLIGADPSPADRVRVTLALGGLSRVLLLPDPDIALIRRVAVDSALAALTAGD